MQSLSPRQREVLALLHRGLQNKQIAYELGLSPVTVKVHLRAIAKKLKARNRVQIVLFTLSQMAKEQNP